MRSFVSNTNFSLLPHSSCIVQYKDEEVERGMEGGRRGEGGGGEDGRDKREKRESEREGGRERPHPLGMWPGQVI